MFTRFYLTVLVAEPTRKSVGVCRQWRQYADGYDVTTVAGNKGASQQGVTFLREHLDEGLLTWLGHESAVRAMEQGSPLALDDLGASTRQKAPPRACPRLG
jgi:CO dehydrogenase maturation factor